MSRRRAAFVIVLIVVLGFVCGWLLQRWWEGGAVSPVNPNAASNATAPKSQRGFCCVTAGKACTDVENPGSCFRAGGQAFNTLQPKCDYYCLNVKP
jgi:hypothetical protein